MARQDFLVTVYVEDGQASAIVREVKINGREVVGLMVRTRQAFIATSPSEVAHLACDHLASIMPEDPEDGDGDDEPSSPDDGRTGTVVHWSNIA